MLPKKINDQELSESLVSSLPLRPAARSKYRGAPMTGEEIRAAFDRAAILIAARLNDLIGLLTEDGGPSIADLPYDGVRLGDLLGELSTIVRQAESRLRTLETASTENTDAVEHAQATADSAQECADHAMIQANRAYDALKTVEEAAIVAESQAKSAATDAERSRLSAEESSRAAVALGESFEDTKRHADEAHEIAMSADTSVNLAFADIERLRALLESLEAVQKRIAPLADNALQKSTTKGIYAYDYDSGTDTYLDRTIKFSPSASYLNSARWSIAQRDGDGCLHAFPPMSDTALTPRSYVESHFRPQAQIKNYTVSGIVEVKDWTVGEYTLYRNGGESVADPDMMSANLDFFFEEGEEVTFYAEGPDVTVSDLYRGDYSVSYDGERGTFIYKMRQKASYVDGERVLSCRISAPVGMVVYYVSKNSADPFIMPLESGYEYRFSGIGVKKLSLLDGEPFRWYKGGGTRIYFSSDTVKVEFVTALPFYFTGDGCINGTLQVQENMRYALDLEYDGVGFLCRVLAYPLPNTEGA